jgi:mannose-1-phosphate guanylyltransferase
MSLPPPLFPLGGYPMIFHHVKALSRLKVQNLYLVGPYPEKKFIPFIDEVSGTFEFEKV